MHTVNVIFDHDPKLDKVVLEMVAEPALDAPISELWADIRFFLNYLPEATATIVTYGFLGAAVGYGLSKTSPDELRKFAAKHHDAVDVTDGYVKEEDEFMHFNRGFTNRRTPSVNEILPVYSSAIGACAGVLFGAFRAKKKFVEKLHAERDERASAKWAV
jgi:hypothetical protein